MKIFETRGFFAFGVADKDFAG